MDGSAPDEGRSPGSELHPVEIVAYDPAWPARFAEVGRELRAGLGEVARRIDHIGATAVPGLAAKPIIDLQISVADLQPVGAAVPRRAALASRGGGRVRGGEAAPGQPLPG